MSDVIYRCLWEKCLYEGCRSDAVRHVMMTHAPLDECPFYCNLCSFRATSWKALQKHTKTFRRHLELLDGSDDRAEYLQKAKKSVYNVTWGTTTSDLMEKDAEIIEEFQIVNVKEDMGIFDKIDFGTQTVQSNYRSEQKLKEEIFVLKGQHKVEMNRMADYISRIEKRLKEKEMEVRQKESEIEDLKVQIRRRDPFVRGFEEMWEELKENSPPTKKRKSVVKRLF